MLLSLVCSYKSRSANAACRMCTLAAIALNIFHPGYIFPDHTVRPDEQGERLQAHTHEKPKEYSTFTERTMAYPAEVRTAGLGSTICPRCACREDRREWI
jgi:hypothetical protein